MFKRTWHFLKILYALIYIASILIIGLVLAYLIFATMGNRAWLEDTFTINFIALALGFISLPGLIVQLMSLININKKKTFTLEKKCPHCNHLIELKLTED
ncbi:hypothetical protein ACN6KS_22740 [Paenibacillus nitricinens]|uniref:hypothetical protein n=1 Tax=Paenibacillus nitricinens TaxID=3367691 RepID=UPI003F85C632